MVDHPGRRALITGVSGQDGTCLARLLLNEGWIVFGGLASSESPASLASHPQSLHPLPLELANPESMNTAVSEAKPDAIFHLAAQSHVPSSWDAPSLTVDINTAGTLRLLEAMMATCPDAHLVFAGSSDCFDHTKAPPTGLTPDSPLSAETPYALSKLAAMQLLQRMRESNNLKISIAILMNHTSPHRPARFVERKIVNGAVAVARGQATALEIGSVDTRRDWSWADDIVDAMRRMAEQDSPGDYVLGSGKLHTTGDWVRLAFDRLGLDPERHLKLNPSLTHRVDPPKTFADLRPAKKELGWSPRTTFEQMVERLIEAEKHRLG